MVCRGVYSKGVGRRGGCRLVVVNVILIYGNGWCTLYTRDVQRPSRDVQRSNSIPLALCDTQASSAIINNNIRIVENAEAELFLRPLLVTSGFTRNTVNFNLLALPHKSTSTDTEDGRTYAQGLGTRYTDVCWRMLLYVDVCWRNVCWRMLTYDTNTDSQGEGGGWVVRCSCDILSTNTRICFIFRRTHGYTERYIHYEIQWVTHRQRNLGTDSRQLTSI
jgi:hypothetical protein